MVGPDLDRSRPSAKSKAVPFSSLISSTTQRNPDLSASDMKKHLSMPLQYASKAVFWRWPVDRSACSADLGSYASSG